MIRIDLQATTGANILAGAVSGRNTLSKLIAEVPAPPTPTPVYIDFSRIDVATASFLRESVLAFRDLVRGQRSTIYPVLANANDAVREELEELVRARGDTLPLCKLGGDGKPREPSLIGELDPKQRITFDLVAKSGETDAGELMRAYGEKEGVTRATAWNNRLSSLASLGLVMEISQGRTKRYRPVLEGA